MMLVLELFLDGLNSILTTVHTRIGRHSRQGPRWFDFGWVTFRYVLFEHFLQFTANVGRVLDASREGIDLSGRDPSRTRILLDAIEQNERRGVHGEVV